MNALTLKIAEHPCVETSVSSTHPGQDPQDRVLKIEQLRRRMLDETEQFLAQSLAPGRVEPFQFRIECCEVLAS
jgi:hypothetical protein